MQKNKDSLPDLSGALDNLDREDLLAIVKRMVNGGVSLSFHGKRTALEIARRIRPRITRNLKDLHVGKPDEQCKNLLIEGENLQAMVTLYKYRGHYHLRSDGNGMNRPAPVPSQKQAKKPFIELLDDPNDKGIKILRIQGKPLVLRSKNQQRLMHQLVDAFIAGDKLPVKSLLIGAGYQDLPIQKALRRTRLWAVLEPILRIEKGLCWLEEKEEEKGRSDLARRWRMSPRTLEGWRRTGVGPPYLKLGHILYRLEDIEKYERDHFCLPSKTVERRSAPNETLAVVLEIGRGLNNLMSRQRSFCCCALPSMLMTMAIVGPRFLQ